ncbi:GNAT family N-acetyltransferase [Streptomyces actinomycinicus]|uniref:GNAT family N-acetyltransferase n=1 Tax=Streptomyces actinomycinicus TaxID=1695166 RepID=A0A937ET01_9ACTN|nr:GNAT family N-acetyltransferase [Streptomyces actinomycinicus]MBL1087616.1 GNAT family N-acetyltransferase [Streptomyces actinomycinicus]
MTDSAVIDIRTVTDDDLPAWTRTWGNGYLRSYTESSVDTIRSTAGRDRLIGAFDLDRCVGTYRSSAQELTVPGGAVLPVSAISKVSVAGTHRRRGLLSRMVAMDLQGAFERGEPLAVLDAAQYPLYGRYGFGPATAMAWFEIDVHRARLDPRRTADVSGVLLVDAREYLKTAPAVYERLRAVQPGALRRDEQWWLDATGQRPAGPPDRPEPFFALYLDPETGEADGLLTFTAEETWGSMLPRSPLWIRDLIAVSPRAESALLRYAVTVDWVTTVHLPYRAPDTLLPLCLGDPRAARISALSDYMWLRILDTPRALSARTYGVDGALVLEVTDPAGHAAGVWSLEGGPDGASCTRTGRGPDLRLGVRDLASLYLGDDSATRLAALGGTEEVRPGALARADAMFRTGRRPWSPRAVLGPRYQAGAP